MYNLKKSTRADKKFMIKLPSGKTVHFGADSFSDYTMHKDRARKANYISRHGAPASREDWNDLSKSGTWSRYILWNKPTIIGSVRDMEKKFGIKISVSL